MYCITSDWCDVFVPRIRKPLLMGYAKLSSRQSQAEERHERMCEMSVDLKKNTPWFLKSNVNIDRNHGNVFDSIISFYSNLIVYCLIVRWLVMKLSVNLNRLVSHSVYCSFVWPFNYLFNALKLYVNLLVRLSANE